MMPRMSRVKQNLVANVAGTAWVAVLQIALVPVFLRLLGVEAYGLIGFYTALQTIFLLADAGLGVAANRELARITASSAVEQAPRRLIRSLEAVYWPVAVLIGGCVWIGAPMIASRWVNAQALDLVTVTRAIRLMGLVIAAQFPFALYSGALLGLQRHVRLNVVLIAGATIRLAAVLPILLWYSRTIDAFFAWQVFATIVQTLLTRVALARSLRVFPPEPRASLIHLPDLIRLRSFAAGITGVAVLSAIVLQADKLAVSRFSSLTVLGYYTIAATIAGGASLAAGPMFATVFPRLSELAAASDDAEFVLLFHRAAQALSAVLIPICVILIVFSDEILLLWTRNVAVASNAGPVLAILAVGTCCNGLMHVPYAAQLAVGWTSLAFTMNVAGIVIMVPGVFMATRFGGSIGAACVVAGWHAALLVVASLIMYRRLLEGEGWRWSAIDVGLPLAVSVSVAIGARQLIARYDSSAPGIPLLASVALLDLLAAIAVTPLARQWLRELAHEARKERV
jgi:O-antigen/teichoic acid export membrane protein